MSDVSGTPWSSAAAAAPAAPPPPSDARDGVDPGPIEETLSEVDAALARLDAGTYGACAVCGDALDDAVLEGDPLARFCAGHLPGTVA